MLCSYSSEPWFHQAIGNAVTVLDYSKKMEQLCREAYLLKKDQVIKLREVLTRMETSGYAGCDKR